jgi:hypothetical protein
MVPLKRALAMMDLLAGEFRRSALLSSALGALLLAACSESPSAPGAPASLAIVSGNGQQAVVGTELPEALIARIVDANGRPVPGQIVNFRVVSGGGSVFAGSAISNSDGIVRERWTLGTSTSVPQRIEARAVDNATGEPLVFAEFTAIAKPGPATSIEVHAGNAQSGSALSTLPESLAAVVRDQYGNPAVGTSVTWTASANAGTFSPNPSIADAEGIARTMWTLGTRGGAVTASVSISGASATFAATTTAAAAANIEAWSGDGQAGVIGELVSGYFFVRVTDAHGIPVGAGVPVQWTAMDSGALMISADPVTDANGFARAQLSLGFFPGVQTVRAVAAMDTALFGATARGLEAASYNGCALTASGAAYCEISPGTFAAVPGGLTFRAITTSGGTYCGITTADILYCWGRFAGQTTAPYMHPGVVMSAVSDVDADGYHVCLLTAAGKPYCWGLNDAGQVGDSTNTERNFPVAVKTSVAFIQIDLGTRMSCGLSTQQEVYCWGENSGGYIVQGAPLENRAPRLAAPGWKFVQITVGYQHVCGLTADGKAYCWGNNDTYLGPILGDGTTSSRSTPGLVAGDHRFTKIIAGNSETCGFTESAALYCWGFNSTGQLGDGTTQHAPVPVRFNLGIGVTDVRPGRTSCGVASGILYCWGAKGGGISIRPWGFAPPT